MGQVHTRSSHIDVTQCRIQQVPTVILRRLLWHPVFSRKLWYFLYPAFTLVMFVAFSILKHLQHINRKVERGLYMYRSASFFLCWFQAGIRTLPCCCFAVGFSSLQTFLCFWQQVGLHVHRTLHFSYSAGVFLSAFFQFSLLRSTG